MLTLVNPWNPLPEDFTCTRTQLANGQSVDERCYPDLQAMMDGCRAAGLSPTICSSYRTQEKQEQLYQNKVARLAAQGWSLEEAKVEAAKSVAIPGTSEHQLGLAVDIVDKHSQVLDNSQADTPPSSAHGAQLGIRLYPPLPRGQERDHRHHLRALALPLRREGSGGGDP